MKTEAVDFIGCLLVVRAFSCGYYHSVLVTLNGDLYAWGNSTRKLILFHFRESVGFESNRPPDYPEARRRTEGSQHCFCVMWYCAHDMPDR